MTTKRTNGQRTCADDRKAMALDAGYHFPDCPSIYPAEQEPDALTRLARTIRALEAYTNHDKATALTETALSLISEAREEQRNARNGGLERAAH